MIFNILKSAKMKKRQGTLSTLGTEILSAISA